MRALLLTSVLLICQLLHDSAAVERDVLDMVSVVLEEYSKDNFNVLDMYLMGKVFVERYTDAQLKEGEKIKEAVMEKVFPAYSNINESEKVEKNLWKFRDSIPALGLPGYFNAYLIKVEDAWKIRKVDGVEITYEDVDGRNVMDLIELMYAMSSVDETNEDNYDVKKLLALIQIKHQIKEETEKAGRGMLNYEREFWDEHDLGSDLIRQAALKNYSFNYVQPRGFGYYGEGPSRDYFGVDGQKYGDFGRFGNVTYAFMLERHLNADTYYKNLNMIPSLRGKYKMIIRKHIKKSLRMNETEKEKTFYLPLEFFQKKLPCQAHLKKVNEKNKTGFIYWKPFCNADGSYSTSEKICVEKRCWCVDDEGNFWKQLYFKSQKCEYN